MALPNPPRAILLDLDDTLIDGSGVISATVAMCEVFTARHPEFRLDPMRLAQANGASWERSWKDHEGQWVRGELDDLGLSTIVWTRALRELGVDEPELFAAEAARDHVSAAAAATRPYDEVLSVLDELAAADVILGVVTNGSSTAQRAKVETLGRERFAVVVVSGEHGVAKPDQRIFEIALAALDLPASEVVHVGDNLVSDIVGASSTGLGTVWVNRSGASRQADAATPDAEIDTLATLPRVIGLSAA